MMKANDINSKTQVEELALESLEQITGAACSPGTALIGAIVGGAVSGASPWGVGAGAVGACMLFPSDRR